MQTLTCDNKKIFLIGNLLSDEQCAWWLKQFKKSSYVNKLFKSEELSKKLWEHISTKICSVEFTDNDGTFIIRGIINEVTFTKTNCQLARHIDTQKDNIKYKLFIYINQLNAHGGTDFYENDEKKVEIPNVKGDAVLFHIALEHGSQPINPNETKYVLGCRPIINYI